MWDRYLIEVDPRDLANWGARIIQKEINKPISRTLKTCASKSNKIFKLLFLLKSLDLPPRDSKCIILGIANNNWCGCPWTIVAQTGHCHTAIKNDFIFVCLPRNNLHRKPVKFGTGMWDQAMEICCISNYQAIVIHTSWQTIFPLYLFCLWWISRFTH